MTVRAIETRYAGCRFRSRLEARWAVFFGQLGIRWEYEPQGYLVGLQARPYLPDFWLPGEKVWVEVKGSSEQLDIDLLVDAAIPNRGLPETGGVADGYQARILMLGPISHCGAIYVTETGEHVGFGRPAHALLSFRDGNLLQGSAWFNSGKPGDAHLGVRLDGGVVASESTGIRWETQSTEWGNLVGGGLLIADESDPEVEAAYKAACSARFEHGESGAS